MVHFRKRICQCGGSKADGLRGGYHRLLLDLPDYPRFYRDTDSKRDVRGAKVPFLIIMCEVLDICLS